MGSRGIMFSLVYGKFSGEVAILAWQARNQKKQALVFGDQTCPSGDQNFLATA